jgi:hypothetical protein
MTHILYIRLYEPDIFTGDVRYRDYSYLSSLPFKTNIVKTWAFTNLPRGEELGRIFEDVKPDSKGNYLLDLAAELPTYWPLPEGQNEWKIDLTNDGETDIIIFSNQMVRALIHKGIPKEEDISYIFPAPLYQAFLDHYNLAEVEIAIEKCKTFVFTRLTTGGADAQEALDNILWDAVNKFIDNLNYFQFIIKTVNIDKAFMIPHSFCRQSIPCVYFGVQGSDTSVINVDKVSTNPSKHGYGWNTFSPEDAQEIEARAQEGYLIPMYNRFLISGRSLVNSGDYTMGFLNVMIGCESCVDVFLDAFLKNEGVSQTSIKRYFDDIGFNTKVRILIPNLVKSVPGFPEDDLVSLSKARKLRNDIVHGRVIQIDDNTSRQFAEVISRYIIYLGSVSSQFGFELQ